MTGQRDELGRNRLGSSAGYGADSHLQINLAALAGDTGVMSPQIPYEKLPPTQQMSS